MYFSLTNNVQFIINCKYTEHTGTDTVGIEYDGYVSRCLRPYRSQYTHLRYYINTALWVYKHIQHHRTVRVHCVVYIVE